MKTFLAHPAFPLFSLDFKHLKYCAKDVGLNTYVNVSIATPYSCLTYFQYNISGQQTHDDNYSLSTFLGSKAESGS